jgi:GT2 family glycosyltransferase
VTPRASLIVATWNAADLLEACLDSIEAQRLPGGFETIVVDDASTDRTPELLAGRAGRVEVVTNEANAGFAAANARGARAARGGVLVFLNPDTELLGPDTLARLVSAAEAPDVAIAGPKLLNPDGTLQPSCAAHPTIPRALLMASGLRRLLPQRLRTRVAPDIWRHDTPIDAGWLVGAALAIRAEVFRDLGGFWPSLYAEDQDLAFRAQRRGLRVRFEPAARVMHVGNQSFGQRQSDAERAERVAAAELRFLRAHYAPPRAAAIRAIVGAGYAGRALLHRAAGRRERAKEYASMSRVYARRRSRGGRSHGRARARPTGTPRA